ncbi:MAG: hypothetical protein CVU61_09385 [Deltaproteobacteria bacterium HGW-Deltaproteobacteria-19]|jgi:hypothetical protein|nr:MAG: hypothetical protein CVU61_09385 [Deltaproteobacteria bacterium HGW-Deltaproteobacteria-19]
MKRIVVASMAESDGKTSMIVGIAKAMGKKIGYLKPFGHRLFYRKKRLWDYDAALITKIFRLEEKPEDITVGFHHAKLGYLIDEETARERFQEILNRISSSYEYLFVEGGKGLTYGLSIHLDPLSVRRYLNGTLLFVLNGAGEDGGMDDLLALQKYLSNAEGAFAGIIINKIKDMDDYREVFLPRIKSTGIPVLGMVPYRIELDCLSAHHLADRLFAKVLSGEEHLNRSIENILVMPTDLSDAREHPLFSSPGKLVITSGDRSDLIAAALDGDTSCVLLTGSIKPPADLMTRAQDLGIPMLLVSMDLVSAAKKIDQIEPLLVADDPVRISLLEDLVRKNVRMEALLS